MTDNHLISDEMSTSHKLCEWVSKRTQGIKYDDTLLFNFWCGYNKTNGKRHFYSVLLIFFADCMCKSGTIFTLSSRLWENNCLINDMDVIRRKWLCRYSISEAEVENVSPIQCKRDKETFRLPFSQPIGVNSCLFFFFCIICIDRYDSRHPTSIKTSKNERTTIKHWKINVVYF